MTETGMLKLFAFVTCLIRVLGCGLQTFKLARYRQFNKRIGRLIRQAPDSLFDYIFVLFSDFNGNKQTMDNVKGMLDCVTKLIIIIIIIIIIRQFLTRHNMGQYTTPITRALIVNVLQNTVMPCHVSMLIALLL